MMSDVEIDPKKLEKMWKLIIEYEKADGLSDNNKTAASNNSRPPVPSGKEIVPLYHAPTGEYI